MAKVFSMGLYVCRHKRWIERPVATRLQTRQYEKKKTEAFSEKNMTIQLQVLTANTLTSLVYMLQSDFQKAPVNMLSCSKHNKWKICTRKKFAIYVPLQKFLFL